MRGAGACMVENNCALSRAIERRCVKRMHSQLWPITALSAFQANGEGCCANSWTWSVKGEAATRVLFSPSMMLPFQLATWLSRLLMRSNRPIGLRFIFPIIVVTFFFGCSTDSRARGLLFRQLDSSWDQAFPVHASEVFCQLILLHFLVGKGCLQNFCPPTQKKGLNQQLIVFRICDGKFWIWDGVGVGMMDSLHRYCFNQKVHYY